jgi:cytoskeletal protein RodZ
VGDCGGFFVPFGIALRTCHESKLTYDGVSLTVSDPFEQIGSKLRRAREAAGLDLVQAADLAQLPRTAAEALEDENFSHFDSPVYAKSFLLKYSAALGVDAKAWLDALEPGSFMASGALVKRPDPARPKESEESVKRGGVASAFILLLIAAGAVIAAIKGCDLFADKIKRSKSAPDAVAPAK